MNEIDRLITVARDRINDATDEAGLNPDQNLQAAQVHALCAIAEAVQKVAAVISESSRDKPQSSTRRASDRSPSDRRF